MADLATLVIEVDASGLTRGERALRSFEKAASNTEIASNKAERKIKELTAVGALMERGFSPSAAKVVASFNSVREAAKRTRDGVIADINAQIQAIENSVDATAKQKREAIKGYKQQAREAEVAYKKELEGLARLSAATRNQIKQNEKLAASFKRQQAADRFFEEVRELNSLNRLLKDNVPLEEARIRLKAKSLRLSEADTQAMIAAKKEFNALTAAKNTNKSATDRANASIQEQMALMTRQIALLKSAEGRHLTMGRAAKIAQLQAQGVLPDTIKDYMELEKQLSKLERTALRSRGAMTSLGLSLKNVLNFAAGFSVFNAAAGALRTFARTAIDVELLGVALANSEGSVFNATVQFDRLAQRASELAVPIQSSVKAFSKFSLIAKETGLSAQVVEETFDNIMVAASGAQLEVEQFDGVMRAFEQMLSKGTVQAEELRGQLGDRLPGAFIFAARAMEMTTAELDKQLKLGQVISSEMIPKLSKVLVEVFGEASANRVNTLGGSIQQLKNEYFLLNKEVAESGLTDTIIFITQSITSLISVMRESSGAISAFIQVGGGLAIVTGAVLGLVAAFKLLQRTMMANPFVLAISAAVVAVSTLFKETVGLKNAAEAYKQSADQAGKSLEFFASTLSRTADEAIALGEAFLPESILEYSEVIKATETTVRGLAEEIASAREATEGGIFEKLLASRVPVVDAIGFIGVTLKRLTGVYEDQEEALNALLDQQDAAISNLKEYRVALENLLAAQGMSTEAASEQQQAFIGYAAGLDTQLALLREGKEAQERFAIKVDATKKATEDGADKTVKYTQVLEDGTKVVYEGVDAYVQKALAHYEEAKAIEAVRKAEEKEKSLREELNTLTSIYQLMLSEGISSREAEAQITREQAEGTSALIIATKEKIQALDDEIGVTNELNNVKETKNELDGELLLVQNALTSAIKNQTTFQEELNKARLQALPPAERAVQIALNAGQAYDEEQAALRELSVTQQAYNLAVKEGITFSKAMAKVRESLVTDAIEKEKLALEKLGEAHDETLEIAREAAEEQKKAYERAAESIEKTFESLFRSALDGFDSFASAIKDSFKDLLAQLLLQATKNTIVIPIVTSLGGSLGINENALSGIVNQLGGGEGIISGLFQGVSSFFSSGTSVGFFERLVEEGGNVLMNFGADFGIGSAESFGSTLLDNAQIIGNELGSAFLAGAGGFAVGSFAAGRGPFSEDAGSLVGTGAAIGSLFGPLGAAIGGAVGLLVSGLIGNVKTLSQTLVVNIGDSFDTVINTVVKRSNLLGSSIRVFNEKLDDVSKALLSGFTNAIESIRESTGLFGESFAALDIEISADVKGKSEEEIQKILEEILQGAIRGAAVLSVFQGFGASLEPVFAKIIDEFTRSFAEFQVNPGGMSIDFGFLFGNNSDAFSSRVNQQVSGFIDGLTPILQRLVDEPALTLRQALEDAGFTIGESMIGLGEIINELGLPLAVVENIVRGVQQFADDVIRIYGSIEDFVSTRQRTFDLLTTDAEKFAFQQQQLSNGFRRLGIEVPKTNKELFDLINNLISVGDIETARQLETLVPAFVAVNDVIRETRDSLVNLVSDQVSSLQRLESLQDSDGVNGAIIQAAIQAARQGSLALQEFARGLSDVDFESLTSAAPDLIALAQSIDETTEAARDFDDALGLLSIEDKLIRPLQAAGLTLDQVQQAALSVDANLDGIPDLLADLLGGLTDAQKQGLQPFLSLILSLVPAAQDFTNTLRSLRRQIVDLSGQSVAIFDINVLQAAVSAAKSTSEILAIIPSLQQAFTALLQERIGQLEEEARVSREAAQKQSEDTIEGIRETYDVLRDQVRELAETQLNIQQRSLEEQQRLRRRAFDRQQEIEKEAFDNSRRAIIDNINSQRDAQIEAIEVQVDATEELIDSLERMRDVAEDLREFVISLSFNDSLSLGTPRQQVQAAQGEFQRLLTLAQGGDIDAARGLRGQANTLLGLARNTFASGEEYQVIFRAVTEGLTAIADDFSTRSIPELQLDAAQEQIEAVRESAQAQIDAVNLQTEELARQFRYAQEDAAFFFSRGLNDESQALRDANRADVDRQIKALNDLQKQEEAAAEARLEAQIAFIDASLKANIDGLKSQLSFQLTGLINAVNLIQNGSSLSDVVSAVNGVINSVDRTTSSVNQNTNAVDGTTNAVDGTTNAVNSSNSILAGFDFSKIGGPGLSIEAALSGFRASLEAARDPMGQRLFSDAVIQQLLNEQFEQLTRFGVTSDNKVPLEALILTQVQDLARAQRFSSGNSWHGLNNARLQDVVRNLEDVAKAQRFSSGNSWHGLNNARLQEVVGGLNSVVDAINRVSVVTASLGSSLDDIARAQRFQGGQSWHGLNNARLQEINSNLREQNRAQGLQQFAKGGISDRPAIFGEAGPEAAVPLPDGRTIPVTLSGPTGTDNTALIAEVRELRRELSNNNSEVNVRIVMPDGKEEVIRDIRRRSRNGETIIYAAGVK